MRLRVDIFKYKGSTCSNGGISSRYDEAVLIWDETKEEIANNPVENSCILLLVPGLGHQKYRAIPLETENKWNMFGGSFIYSSDSRFPFDYPIPLHDRNE